MQANGSVEESVRALAESLVNRDGYQLVDIEYGPEPGGWALRVFIDKPGGVTLEDCERISHGLGTVLEVEDPIPHGYRLEVSSPGLDRPLKKISDFLAAVGQRVKVVLCEPNESGQRNITGCLVSAEEPGGDPVVRIREDSGAEHVIAVPGIRKARLLYDWDADLRRPRNEETKTKSGTGPGKKKKK